MKRILTVGLAYTGDPIEDVKFENLGLCRPSAARDKAAFPLYEYDVVAINPQSYTHFLFGEAGEFSDSPNELTDLKKKNNAYDLDSAFDEVDRQKELQAAIAAGTNVVWCLAEPKRMNFFGYRETHIGYVAPYVAEIVKRSALFAKKGRRMGRVDPSTPFVKYFDVLSQGGWSLCLANPDSGDRFTSVASTPEGYSLGGWIKVGKTLGWLLTPPSTPAAANQLILDALGLDKPSSVVGTYDGIFLSHTAADKPFVRRLREDLLGHGVPRVWIDEAEIEIGDSLMTKIEQGMKETRYIGVVLSPRSIDAPWVKKELEVAINREISGGQVVVLPLIYERCTLPTFLQGKLYADFTSPEKYEAELAKLLRRLRIR
jgi:TIR domain